MSPRTFLPPFGTYALGRVAVCRFVVPLLRDRTGADVLDRDLVAVRVLRAGAALVREALRTTARPRDFLTGRRREFPSSCSMWSLMMRCNCEDVEADLMSLALMPSSLASFLNPASVAMMVSSF